MAVRPPDTKFDLHQGRARRWRDMPARPGSFVFQMAMQGSDGLADGLLCGYPKRAEIQKCVNQRWHFPHIDRHTC